jgi:hypothetical protein
LHFVIIGALSRGISGAPRIQKAEDFLSQSFLGIKNGIIFPFKFTNSTFPETDGGIDAVEIFCNSHCYKNVWLDQGGRK